MSELDMMQMSDSAFPAGTFAMSNGMEAMHAAGELAGARDVEGLLRSYTIHQSGPSDCRAAARANCHARDGDIAGMLELDAAYLASKSVREIRDASVRSGSQMIRCISGILHDEMVECCAGHIQEGRMGGAYPVAYGVCCNAMGTSEYGAALGVAYGFVTGCVGAALRLGIIQHIEAQGIIHNLKPHMKQAARDGCEAGVLWQFCPQAEIRQMAHENQESKMFIT